MCLLNNTKTVLAQFNEVITELQAFAADRRENLASLPWEEIVQLQYNRSFNNASVPGILLRMIDFPACAKTGQPERPQLDR